MSKLFHLFRLKKHYKRSNFSFKFKPLSDHSKEDNTDDDWEFVKVQNKELGSSSKGDDGYMVMCDPVEGEDSPVNQHGSSGDGDDGCMELHDPVKAKDSHFASANKTKYRILSRADVRKRLEDKVTSVCEVLLLTRNDALLLLHHFKWNAQRTQEEWLTCEEKVRNAVGLLQKPVIEIPVTTETSCALCLEKADTIHVVSCGHQICRGCWTDYISRSVSEGPGCMVLRCPATSCEAAVGLDMIELVASLEDKKKFDDYLLESSVTSRKAKFCPAVDCEFAIFAPLGSEGSSDVTCHCLHSFCWNCSQEAHGPIDCATVGKWGSEIILQSHNWLLANTRPCPCCKELIETDPFKIFAQCPACNYELRISDMTKPATESSTWNDMFSLPEPATELSTRADLSILPEPSDHDLELARKRAEESLAIFKSYYEGWSTSEVCRINALEVLRTWEEVPLQVLCDISFISVKDCKFLVDAQVQVIHCWRLLKWMYVYGYYLSVHDNSKRGLFDFTIDQALRLVKMLERHVEQMLSIEEHSLAQYKDNYKKLLQLTRVTRNYFEKFSNPLEYGLSEEASSPRRKTDTFPSIEGVADEAQP